MIESMEQQAKSGIKRTGRDAACVLVLAVLSGFLVVRSFYGFDWTDESFQLSIAWRYLQGDCPVVEEWHLTQFYSILIVPFVGIYTALSGGTDGILLAGRLVFCMLDLVIAVWTYLALSKRTHRVPALFCAGLVLFVSRQNIQGLSYYQLYPLFLTAGALLFLDEEDHGISFVRSFFIGLFQGMAMMCMPFLGVPVLLFLLVRWIRQGWKAGLSCFAGAFLFPCLFVLVILFHGYGLGDCLAAFRCMLEDPEHAAGGFGAKASETLNRLWPQVRLFLVFAAYILFSRLRHLKNRLADTAVFLLCLVYMMVSQYAYASPGVLYDQLTFLGIPLLFVSGSRIGKRFWGYGVLCALVFWIGSNTGVTCLCCGFVLSSVGTVLMLADGGTGEGLSSRQEIYRRILLFAAMGACLACLLYLRFAVVYRDDAIPNLTVTLTEGPGAGIRTCPEMAEDYQKVLDTIDLVEELEPDRTRKIFFTRKVPWAYLAEDYAFGTCTEWNLPLDSALQAMYYEQRPDRVPDIIVVLSPEVGAQKGLDGSKTPNAGNENADEILSAAGYIGIDAPAGRIYLRHLDG